ncbi:MAG: FprA family A-type flavoprotein [Fibrobacteria bacterium]|nr:FprA family A-type flavoprotein [Fibrobacteria bacterium]
MKAKKIKEGIYWVGAVDWDLRNFHGYLTQRGSTYNAYLIVDEKITLVDSVKANKTDEMLARIRDVIDPAKIDYVVCNHVEMDHSGSIPAVLALAPGAEVIASPKGVEGLKAHFNQPWSYKQVNSGDNLSLGKRTLTFVATPMVHWPDNMVAYLVEDKILFSNDAFGQHYASSGLFDDENPHDIVMHEARKYYANIVLPYSKQVTKALKILGGLEIECIACSHGVLWRKHISEIIKQYQAWSSNVTATKAVIVYDTMWNSTEMMAYAIQDAFEEKGYVTVMCNLQNVHISDIMTEIIDAEYVCAGSPTLNRTLMPSVAGFLTYLKGLSPQGRKAIAFGSYGWGGQSIKDVEKYLLDSNMEVKGSYKFKYIPGNNDLKEIKSQVKEQIN